MTIVDELIARRDFVLFDPRWVDHYPRKINEECLILRRVGEERYDCHTTLSDATHAWLRDFTYRVYQCSPSVLNDYYPKETLIDALDAAILAAKEQGV